MLTAAQQKVKQELEELQLKARIHLNEEIDFPHTSHSLKKWIFTVIGLFAFAMICSLLTVDYSTPSHEQIVSYLESVQKYNAQSEELLNDLFEKKTDEFQQAKAKQTELLEKINALPTPSSLKSHKQDLMDVLEQRLDVFTYLSTTKTINSIQLNKKLLELKIKQELAKDSLLKAFEKEGIKHVLQEDDTVQYWIKSKAYQY